jgi:hypothetical protein
MGNYCTFARILTLGASGRQRNRKRLKANTCDRSKRVEQEEYQLEIRCEKSEIFPNI